MPDTPSKYSTQSRSTRTALIIGAMTVCLALLIMGSFLPLAGPARAAGGLSIEVIAGPNLVVDSNVSSPSTYAPSVATIIVKFTNSGTDPITNVVGYIGDFTAGTPGVYPARDSSDAGFIAEHAHLADSGLYRFTHIGGSAGLGDAARPMFGLAPGETKVQYWHFTYPRCEDSIDPPCGANAPVWGATNDPNDDLWLNYDVWGTAIDTSDGSSLSANVTKKATMRNEISAMANKIEPHGGAWFNTNTDMVAPGDTITTNGVRYELGNIRQGFDNDGDLVPDYNAWLQPIGDPSWDPSCFRLIRTTGALTVSRSGGNPDLIIPFTDTLYFSNLPPDNNGVIGNVYYTFLALDGPCNTALTPYQEVASGHDNEKFNGDYGAGIPSPASTEPAVEVDKTGNFTVTPGSIINYSVDVDNSAGTADAGLPFYNTGLVVSDTIPANTTYASGSASSADGTTIRYSTDGGVTWTITEPVPASSVTHIQWWFNDPLAAGASSGVTFDVNVSGSPTSPFIENCAATSFGTGVPFDEDCHITMIEGTNQIGDRVWKDDDGDGVQDGGETGIANITVSLYWDENGNGTLDSGELLIMTTETDSSGNYLFDKLPNGNFIVVVDDMDANLPTGYSLTTPGTHAVTGLGTTTASPHLTADFGFGPALRLDKLQSPANPINEGSLVTYAIQLVNTRPGDGTGSTSCTYKTWATAGSTGGSPKDFANYTNAFGSTGPDGSYAAGTFVGGSNKYIIGRSFSQGNPGGTITKVEAIFQVYVGASLTDDFAYCQLISGTTVLTQTSQTPAVAALGPFSTAKINQFVGAANAGLLVWNVTNYGPVGSWDWNDFALDLSLRLDLQKDQAADSVILYMDAIGFRVTASGTCGGSDSTIATLPLTDTFDAARLQFVSASPVQTSVAGGTILWRDLGPLYAGQTKIVTVIMRALQPATEAQASTVNTAYVTNAKFSSSRAVNDATDSVTTFINPRGTIGDRIWYDSNNNTLDDPGEPGLRGVTVNLCSAANCTGILATTVTDASGYYLFSGLANGTYYVCVDTASLPGGATGWANTRDREGTPGDSRTSALTINNTDGIPGNNDVLNADFGYYRAANAIVYGNVWEDNNGNTTQQTGENGIGTVTVQLRRSSDGAVVATTTADANGNYRFTGLTVTGNHYVQIDTTTLPAGGTWTNTRDPEGTPGNSQTNAFTIAAGGYYGSYDFGYHRSGAYSIGDTVYVDWNGNGSQNSGEEGIPNITVWLYEDANKNGVIDVGTDALISTTITNASGVYGFNNLAGSASGLGYIVVVDRTDSDWPAGTYVQTQDYDGTKDDKAKVTLTTASIDTVDFGYQPIGGGSIGDLVWRDDNRNGIWNTGEPGLANITVNLYEDSNNDGIIDSGDALVATTSTDANGLYSFVNLPAGNYLVDVDTTDPQLPTDGYGNRYVLSTHNDPHDVTLSAGQAYVLADFGFTAGGRIGDTIWQDNDGNGLYDQLSEPGISGVTVWLYNDVNGDGQYDVGDTLYDTQVTDATGVYSFTGLLSGKYVVVVDEGSAALSGFTQTGDPDETSACGGLGACDAESGVILPNGGVNMTRDFGYQPATYLGDYIWLDSNRDGMQDATEIGLGNVVVILTPPGGVDLGKGAGNPISTTTNSDGYYTFGDLPDGTYTVQVDASTLPTTTLEATYEYNNTATPDGQVDVVINVSSGNSGGVATINGTSCSDCALDVDFGYDYPQGPYSLSGITFHDSYSAGTYDPPGDTAYPGVTVYLWMHTSGGNYTLINTTVSNGSGNFSFTDLYTGTYKATTSPVAPGGENITTPSQYTRLLNAANPTSTGNNFGFWTPSPTAVTLFDFKATPEGAGIQVTWETALEMDMLGFNLYRAEALGGAWTQLNVSLIPGRGSSGGSYVYTDNTAVPGVTYYYRLDIVASDSSVTYYGPVSATVIPDTWYHIYLPLIGR